MRTVEQTPFGLCIAVLKPSALTLLAAFAVAVGCRLLLAPWKQMCRRLTLLQFPLHRHARHTL